MQLYFIIFLLFIIVSAVVRYYLKYFVPLRRKEPGFEYVYVKDDGSVRELDKSEEVYLREEFHPNDGARPYIKFSYKELTPDGKISGFIARRRVPAKISISMGK